MDPITAPKTPAVESVSAKSARELLHGAALVGKRDDGLEREFCFERGSVDVAARTAVLSFSSEFPVKRRDYAGREFYEVLDHEHVDMSRMNDGAPLLYGHDRRDHLGTITAAAIGSDKRGRALVKFSRSTFANEKFQDVQDGILTKTSVGYDLGDAEYVVEGERDGVPVYRFRNWQPYEATLTPIPADPSVGVGREKAKDESPAAKSAAPIITQPSRKMENPTPAPVAPAPAVVNDITAERQRIKDLNAAAKVLGERHPDKAEAFRNLAAACSEAGDSIDAFNRCALNDILATKQDVSPVRQSPDAGKIGLSAKDTKRYSIMRAIQAVVNNRPLDGLERECNDEMARKLERQPKGFFLPEEIAADRRAHLRTMTATTPADGGYLKSEQLLGSELVEYLRNNSVVAQLGARVISGLQGDVTIPRQLTGATAYWVSETGSITQSNATFGQIIGRPRRLGTSVPYSKQFLSQASLDAESFIVRDSDDSIAVELDRVALRGTGGAEPLGVANLASGDRSTAVTFGAAPTWAKYLEFVANVAANNALVGTPAYVASVASAVKAMSIAKFSGGDTGIWDNDMVGTFRARWTTQLLTSATPVANMVIFGDWSQVLFLEWAGRDVVVDPYSGKKEGNVEVTIQRLMDVVIRRAKSFATSADSGAQ